MSWIRPQGDVVSQLQIDTRRDTVSSKPIKSNRCMHFMLHEKDRDTYRHQCLVVEIGKGRELKVREGWGIREE